MKQMFALFLVLLAAGEGPAKAGSTYGLATNVAVTPAGLYIVPGAGLPSDCSTSTNGWLLVQVSNAAMIAEVMSLVARNMRMMLITDGTRDAGGYCYATQVYEHP